MRKRIYDIINPLYPCYALGEHKGECTEPYVVLKFDSQLTSMNNSQFGWQYVHVFLYAPMGDITVLDKMADEIKKSDLKELLEDTGEITPEVVDDTKRAYFRRLKYRIPKEVV